MFEWLTEYYKWQSWTTVVEEGPNHRDIPEYWEGVGQYFEKYRCETNCRDQELCMQLLSAP